MKNSLILKQVPLYRFLDFCLSNSDEDNRKILDCGAGGKTPPLSLFRQHNFQTYGIDLDENAVKDAMKFGDELGQSLNIAVGDMTDLPFEDCSFDFVYSYNSIFHMKKNNIEKAVTELKRVLKPNGLMFVNFLSIDDFRCGEGPDLGDNQFEQMDDEPVIHSYYGHHEADQYFDDMALLVKEQRIFQRIYEGNLIKQGFVDYILKK
jgi:ubiquinone/menaquinone biosynthesis C-methylase UbiE